MNNSDSLSQPQEKPGFAFLIDAFLSFPSSTSFSLGNANRKPDFQVSARIVKYGSSITLELARVDRSLGGKILGTQINYGGGQSLNRR